jgi:hypothetical protein
MSLQASELLVRKQANASELRQRASAQQAAKDNAAEEKRAARLDQHAQAQPEETPVIEVGMHLEILTEITEEVADEDGADGKAVIKKYKQWLPVTVISSAATPGRGKAPARNTSLPRVLIWFLMCRVGCLGGRRAPDWYLVKYECDGEEEWLRLKEFNCNSRGSWRIDLDYERDAPEAEAELSFESEDAETENSSSSRGESQSESESEANSINEEGNSDDDSS